MPRRKNHRKRVGPLTELLGADNIDTRDYHGHAGDVIRIDPYTLFKIDKILVAIHAEKAGLIEHGLAEPVPRTDEWLYIARVENPEKDDWSIAVSAVQALGQKKSNRSTKCSLR